jgi:hypothetical protein
MARVALYGAGGAPYNHAAILAEAGHEVRFVFPADIIAGALESFDAFVMPGGGYLAMQGQLDPLGFEGCRTIREYVETGGIYIGSCAGSYDAATVPDRFLEAVPAQAELRLVDARVWTDGASLLGVIQSPGIGELVAANVASEHPVMAGIPEEFRITHYNGPLFTGGNSLAVVTGATSNFTPAENFLGASPDNEGALLIDEAVAAGVSNIVADERGEGRVVLFGSHPEFGASLTMEDAGLPATMLLNAVAWQMQAKAATDAASAAPGVALVTEAPIAPETVAADLRRLPQTVAEIHRRCAALAARTDEALWLGEGQAMSMFGKSGLEVWNNALVRIPGFADEALAGAAGLPDSILSFRPPADWAVDGGFWGVAPLLEQTAEMLAAADAAWTESYPASEGYEHMRDSPYHLVAGSYLAGVGRASAAALLTRAFSAAPVSAVA